MDEFARALGPAFAAGFAIQRLLEIVDPLTDKIWTAQDAKQKKIILGLVSLVVGVILAVFAQIRILEPLDVTAAVWVDVVITALVISAGTEGLNSTIKFIEHSKDDKKADVEARKAEAESGSL